MESLYPELSLLENNKPSFVPKIIRDLLSEIASIDSSSERSSKINEFMNKLNQEKTKLEMSGELPLSTLIFNEVIEAVNKELIHYRKKPCEDEKRSSFQLRINGDSKKTNFESNRNQNSSSHKFMGVMEERTSSNMMDRTGAFPSFQGFCTDPTMAKAMLKFSYRNPETLNPKEVVGFGGNSVTSITPSGSSKLPAVPLPTPPRQQQQASSRKQRMCWSSELHNLFVHCLQRLGGPQVATPKQIKELMKVDGLTTDEVKSHLQGIMEERTSSNNMDRTGPFPSFQRFRTDPTMATGKGNNENGLSMPKFSYRNPETLNLKEVVGFGGNSVTSITPSGASKLPAVLLPTPPRQQLQQAASRKQRRCWSSELHNLFIHCLQQLGGPQVARPKQIKELMKVDGLTTDEVKSHLQKYRIHIRRFPDGTSNSKNL